MSVVFNKFFFYLLKLASGNASSIEPQPSNDFAVPLADLPDLGLTVSNNPTQNKTVVYAP